MAAVGEDAPADATTGYDRTMVGANLWRRAAQGAPRPRSKGDKASPPDRTGTCLPLSRPTRLRVGGALASGGRTAGRRGAAISFLIAMIAPAALASAALASEIDNGPDMFALHRAALIAEAQGDRAAALPGFEAACEDGLAASCAMAAALRLETARDGEGFRDAAALFARACLAGDERACERTGFALGRLSTTTAAARGGLVMTALLQMGEECRANPADAACTDAAALLHAERLGGADLSAIADYAAAACTVQNRPACALAMVAAPATMSAAQRFDRDQTRCRDGRADGCSALLHALRRGGADADRARRALDAACTRRVGIACLHLGQYHRDGPDAARDPAAARRAMRAGCDGAVAQACLALSAMQRTDEGGPVDTRRADALLSHACELGSAAACARLAQATEAGLDPATLRGLSAPQLRALACRFGDRASCLAREGTTR